MEITYVPAETPVAISEYMGDPITLFGYYRVRLDDGFTLLSAHAGHQGTVSAWPVDLEANPDFVRILTEEAERARSSRTP